MRERGWRFLREGDQFDFKIQKGVRDLKCFDWRDVYALVGDRRKPKEQRN